MLIGNEPLDLQLTLMDSAQCFLWTRRDGRYGSVLGGEPVWLRRDGDGLHAEGGDRGRLRDYLDLDRDYAALAEEYSALPKARRAVELYPGLRVLNQDPWDALVSFILSANNNVVRIRNLCDRLAGRFGEERKTPYGPLYALPSPGRLADCREEELRALGMGYRAPYLIRTARRVCDGFPLWELCRMEYGAAHAALTELSGVGDKVADCVLLFGCRHASAFPVDTWVDKLLKSWFGAVGTGRKQLQRESRALLGEHAGLLQQFLFHAARTGEIPLSEAEEADGSD